MPVLYTLWSCRRDNHHYLQAVRPATRSTWVWSRNLQHTHSPVCGTNIPWPPACRPIRSPRFGSSSWLSDRPVVQTLLCLDRIVLSHTHSPICRTIRRLSKKATLGLADILKEAMISRTPAPNSRHTDAYWSYRAQKNQLFTDWRLQQSLMRGRSKASSSGTLLSLCLSSASCTSVEHGVPGSNIPNLCQKTSMCDPVVWVLCVMSTHVLDVYHLTHLTTYTRVR